MNRKHWMKIRFLVNIVLLVYVGTACGSPEIKDESSTVRPDTVKNETKVEHQPVKEQTEDVKCTLSLDKNTLLMGDSLIYGVDRSGLLQEVQYVAKVGVNVETIQQDGTYDTEYGKLSGIQAVEKLNPKAVVVLCGVNGITWMDIDGMIENYKHFLEMIAKEGRKLAVVSVAPVTKKYHQGKKGNRNIQNRIDLYNEKLKVLAQMGNVDYIDISSQFKDEEGFLREELADVDGLHWNESGNTLFVKIFREYVQKDMEDLQ